MTLRWYGLLMAAGVLTGLIWLSRQVAGSKLADHTLNLFSVAVVMGIVSARLAFVVIKWPQFSDGGLWAMINLQTGGLSIHGALIGGALAVWAYGWINRLSVLKILDLLVPAVLLGQMVGRFGNFFNQEAFGPPTDLPWKMFVSEPFRPVGWESYEFFHPTFIYSVIGLLAILVIILALRQHNLINGGIFLVYVIGYSLLRFGIEFFRVDSDYLGGLTMAQWASLVIIIIAAVISLILRCNLKRRS